MWAFLGVLSPRFSRAFPVRLASAFSSAPRWPHRIRSLWCPLPVPFRAWLHHFYLVTALDVSQPLPHLCCSTSCVFIYYKCLLLRFSEVSPLLPCWDDPCLWLSLREAQVQSPLMSCKLKRFFCGLDMWRTVRLDIKMLVHSCFQWFFSAVPLLSVLVWESRMPG